VTVKELIEKLQTFDPNLSVAYAQYSEYTAMKPEDIWPAELFDNGGYLSHPYRKKDHALVKTFLLFPGN